MAVHRLSRQLVYGCRGMICSNSPLAASVGIKVLQEGGNAFDAALAVAAGRDGRHCASLWVGWGFLCPPPRSANRQDHGRITAAAWRPQEPPRRTIAPRVTVTMPLDGPHAVSVPGEVAAWEVIHQRFCTKPFAQLLDGAIGYAENGFPLPPGIGRSFASNARKLAQFPSTASVLLRRGDAPEGRRCAGERGPGTLITTGGTGGAEEFYRGDLARRMVQGLEAGGGLFTVADFAGHQAEVYEPIATTYRGHTVYQNSPALAGLFAAGDAESRRRFSLEHRWGRIALRLSI